MSNISSSERTAHSLALLKKGIWVDGEGNETPILSLKDVHLIRIARRLNRYRTTPPGHKDRSEEEQVFSIIKAEVDRRGLKPWGIWGGGLCFCGKTGLYRYSNKCYCKEHYDRAVALTKARSALLDRTRRAAREAIEVDKDKTVRAKQRLTQLHRSGKQKK